VLSLGISADWVESVAVHARFRRVHRAAVHNLWMKPVAVNALLSRLGLGPHALAMLNPVWDALSEKRSDLIVLEKERPGQARARTPFDVTTPRSRARPSPARLRLRPSA